MHAGVAALLHGQRGCGGEDGFRASGITCGGGDDEVVICRGGSLRGVRCRMCVAGCGYFVACRSGRCGSRCGSGGCAAAHVVRAGGRGLVEPAEVIGSGFAQVSTGVCTLSGAVCGEERLGCGSRLGEGAGRILRGLCRRARLARLFVGAACGVQVLIGQNHGGVVGGECRLPQVTFGGGGRRVGRMLLRVVVLCVH